MIRFAKRLSTAALAATSVWFGTAACSSAPASGLHSSAGGNQGTSYGGGNGTGGDPGTGNTSNSGSGGDQGFIGGGGPPASACANSAVSVLFVIDRSGSMNCNLPPTTASADCEAMSPPAKVDSSKPSKWEVISQTMSTALDELTPTDPTVTVRAGLVYFSVDGVCGATSTPAVPVDTVTPAQLDKIRASVAAQKPKGGTPIVGATVLGYNYLYQTLGVTGNAHIILITDGADSCGDYYSANPAIGPGDQVAKLISTESPQALGVGIKTWVIGAPGSEPARFTLSSLAVAGGTGRKGCNAGNASDPTSGDCHYDMTTTTDFGAGLKTALNAIMDVVTCKGIM